MKLEQFRLVKTISESGTLTAAAQKLHVTQSALSHQLRQLEDNLGASLFYRIRKKMVPTPAGHRLFQAAERVLRESRDAERQIRDMISGVEGTIRLCTGCYASYYWLPTMIKSFRQERENIRIEINDNATFDLVDHMLDGSLDVGLTNNVSDTDEICYREIFPDQIFAVVHNSHPWAKKQHIEPDDFLNEPTYVYAIPKSESAFYQDFLKPAGVEPRNLHAIPVVDAIVEMARAGLGVAVLAHWVVKPSLKSSGLVTIPLGQDGLHRKWYAAHLRGPGTPQYVLEFVDHLVTHEII